MATKLFKPLEIPYEHYEVHGVPMSLLTGDNIYYIS